MYESMTALLGKIAASAKGQWVIDKENDGSPEHPIQLPYVDYNDAVLELIHAVYRFVKDHSEMELTDYQQILEDNGIQFGDEGIKTADVSSLDGRTVVALLLSIIRMDRFCEGLLLEYCETGYVEKWLARLREIDQSGSCN